jgi:uncharacterized membrane protein YtjA (UPF0391 family)
MPLALFTENNIPVSCQPGSRSTAVFEAFFSRTISSNDQPAAFLRTHQRTGWNGTILYPLPMKIYSLKKPISMLRWTLIFLVVAIIAAIFGFGGIAAGAASIAKILFYIFLVLFVLSLVAGGFRRVD